MNPLFVMLQKTLIPSEVSNLAVMDHNIKFLELARKSFPGPTEQKVLNDLIAQQQSVLTEFSALVLNGRIKVQKYLSCQDANIATLNARAQQSASIQVLSKHFKDQAQNIVAESKKLPTQQALLNYVKKLVGVLSVPEKLALVLRRLKQYENLYTYLRANVTTHH